MSPIPKKKAAARKPATKKKAAQKRKAAAKKKVSAAPPGYNLLAGSKLYTPRVPRPSGQNMPVDPGKIRSGVAKAKSEISNLLQELSEITDGFDISEIELQVSFSADGKFLGFGVGGATTISMRFSPSES